jgi:hypothetical protein
VAAAPLDPSGKPCYPVELERDGTFLLRHVHPGRYDVGVFAGAWGGGQEPLAVAAGVEGRDGARGDVPTFDLRGVLREVVVRVTAEDVRAPAAQLAYRPSGSDAEWSTVTAIGTTRIITPAPALDLVATAPGYVAAEAAAAVGGTVALRLVRGIPVTLRLSEPDLHGWWEVGAHPGEQHGNVAVYAGEVEVREGVELRVPRPGFHTVNVSFRWFELEELQRFQERVRSAEDDPLTWSEILAGPDRVAGVKRLEREVGIDVLDTRAGQTFWIEVPPEVPRRVAAPAER